MLMAGLVNEGQSQFSLSKHVIPLTALKKRVEGVEIASEANGAAVDATNLRLAETTKVLMETPPARAVRARAAQPIQE